MGGGVGGGGGVQSHFHVKPNSVEVVLRLSWGCDNFEYIEDWNVFQILILDRKIMTINKQAV